MSKTSDPWCRNIMLFVYRQQCACIISLPIPKSSVVSRECFHVVQAGVALCGCLLFSGSLYHPILATCITPDEAAEKML